MSYNTETLEKVWEVELTILDVIHAICQEHNLKYSLAFGTLIGAMRHGGFIPWDDDIDLVMPRSDYDRLISVWEASAPSDYILQRKDSDKDFEQNFIKIRKNNTTFLQDEHERKKTYHKGIFVDIAPCDRAAPTRLGRLVQYFACAIELLYSKEHTSGMGGAIGLCERVFLLIPRACRPTIRKMAIKIIGHWNNRTDLPWFCSDTIQNCRRYFSEHLFDACCRIPFQGKEYYAFARPEDFLFVRYGDYMQLPPEEDRVWKHHPIIIDFEHNYEELKYD